MQQPARRNVRIQSFITSQDTFCFEVSEIVVLQAIMSVSFPPEQTPLTCSGTDIVFEPHRHS
jgi:hypothetical protein